MPIPLLKYAIDKDVIAFTTTREGGVSEGNAAVGEESLAGDGGIRE